jgi:arsenate reductase (glutaredoxin)
MKVPYSDREKRISSVTHDVQMFFNPSCSKCRTVKGILEEEGLDIDYIRYLEKTPSRAELERVLDLLGTDDPRKIIRRKERIYRELGLASADRDALLDALIDNPILIERPIIIRGDKAVIGRPPERVLDLFD